MNKIDIKTSCGGVLIDNRSELKICLVNKLSRNEWLLPKGGVKGEEALIQTAQREVTEETGYTDIELLDQEPVASLTIYPDEHTEKHIHYYVFTLKSDINNCNLQDVGEGLQPAWFTLEDALSQVKHEDQKDAIRAAIKRTISTTK